MALSKGYAQSLNKTDKPEIKKIVVAIVRLVVVIAVIALLVNLGIRYRTNVVKYQIKKNSQNAEDGIPVYNLSCGETRTRLPERLDQAVFVVPPKCTSGWMIMPHGIRQIEYWPTNCADFIFPDPNAVNHETDPVHECPEWRISDGRIRPYESVRVSNPNSEEIRVQVTISY